MVGCRKDVAYMDVYELIATFVPQDKTALRVTHFNDELCNQLTSDFDKSAYTLLKNVISLHASYDKENVTYTPAFVFGDKRTFQDLTDSDYELLYLLNLEKLPEVLSLRVADILWTEKGDYRKAQYAINKSYALYTDCFDETDWPKCLSYLEHAVGLAAKTNSPLLSGYLQEAYNKVLELNGTDPHYLSLRLIKLLTHQKWKNYDSIISVLDIIIANSVLNIEKTRQAFELKTIILYKQNQPDSAMENNRRLAKYLEDRVALKDTENFSGLLGAEKLLIEAIHLYRNNGAPEEGARLQIQLISLQKDIPKHMQVLTSTVDGTAARKNIVSLFSAKQFEEQIVHLTLITSLLKKDYLEQRVLTNAADPLSALFGSGIKSAQGQTLAELPPINKANPHENMEVLEQHMHHEAFLIEQIYGETTLKWALEIIQQENDITDQSLNFLVSDNPIIPEGRERIFLAGLYQGMVGNLYRALHILAPQVENLFRKIAELAGAVVSTLNSDATSDAKLLSSIFELPELLDCYDNDILFLFKGLMNEKVGANIRNEIAHGLMSEKKGNSGSARFFFCWVLKLLAFTSNKYHELWNLYIGDCKNHQQTDA